MQRINKKLSKALALASRFEVITLQNKTILVANYSLSNRDEVWALTNKVNDWLGEQPPNSANILFDMHKPFYEASHVNHWKKSLGRYDAIIRKSCFINASPFMQMMVPTMRTFAALTGAPMKKDRGIFFKDREAALTWLSE